jgi:hypothetical protein
VSDAIARAVARALKTKRIDAPPHQAYAACPNDPNVIPDPVETGHFGAARTVEERIAYTRVYRDAITWSTTLSLRYAGGTCPVTPAHHLFRGDWWRDNLPGDDVLRHHEEIIDLGARENAIRASAEAQVARDLQDYLPEALQPFPPR